LRDEILGEETKKRVTEAVVRKKSATLKGGRGFNVRKYL